LLYVGSFLSFQMFSTQSYQADGITHRHQLVLFSRNPRSHDRLRTLYAPLIEILPGGKYYPTQAEVAQLTQD
ncbi:MAG: hypothetical protein KDA60_20105, partial [Planctomycetales bacterium]|nr:hypothetical protein [Planctomycetales bacterium]